MNSIPKNPPRPDAAADARDNDNRDAIAAARALQDADRKRIAEEEIHSHN